MDRAGRQQGARHADVERAEPRNETLVSEHLDAITSAEIVLSRMAMNAFPTPGPEQVPGEVEQADADGNGEEEEPAVVGEAGSEQGGRGNADAGHAAGDRFPVEP